MVRYSRVAECLIFTCVFLFIFCISTTASDNVETDCSFEFIDGTHLTVDMVIDVHEITLPENGITYTQLEIQALSKSNPEMIGAIKFSVKGLMLDQLYESFPGAQIDSLQELPVYANGVFTDECVISLSSTFFSLNDSVDSNLLINGFLDCGAYVNYTFLLKSYNGWNQSFAFSFVEPLNYKITNGDVNQNHISWTVLTFGESSEKDAHMTLFNGEPTSEYAENETIHVHINVDCTSPDQPVLNLQVWGYSTMIARYSKIPEFISHIKSIPADAVRLSVSQNLTSWELIKNGTFQPVYNQVKSVLENSSFNQSISTMFSWVNSTTVSASNSINVSHIDTNPPITANYNDDEIEFRICDCPSYAFFGLINAGGRANITENDINVGEGLEHISYPYQGNIVLPEHVLYNNVNNVSWDEDTAIRGSFTSENPLIYDTYNISTDFEIIVKNTDLNLLSFFTGKTELSMGLSLTETQDVHVTEPPFHFQIPEQMKITLLNSDALRICMDEQVFTDEQIKSYISYNKNVFHSRSKILFPLIKGSPQFDQSLFDSSRLWDGNISSMDSSKPLILSSSVQTTYPLVFDFSIFPPRVSIQPLNLSFTGITHQDVTYTMKFPKGISIGVSDALNRANIQEYPDGRYGFSLSFDREEGGTINSVLVSMRPSGFYIIGMFVPCIMSFIVTIILLVLVFIIRRKMKTMPSSSKEDQHADYEQEDYYVPPPPAKRR